MSARPSPIVTVEPGLLDEERAGAFLSRSVAWIRLMRQTDLDRLKRGDEPEGPPWIVIGRSVFYQPEALRAWIASRAVVRGKVSFDKRQPATAATPGDAE